VHVNVKAAEHWLRLKGQKIMTGALNYEVMVKMLLGAAEQIKENHARLSELDSFGGDGDHGTTMLRAMENLENSVNASQAGQIKKLLSDVGWAVMSTDGGATGPLFGSFFMGMSNGVAEAEALDVGAVAEMFEAGLDYLRKQTKAQIGDKTVIDALAPAVKEARRAADEGLDIFQPSSSRPPMPPARGLILPEIWSPAWVERRTPLNKVWATKTRGRFPFL